MHCLIMADTEEKVNKAKKLIHNVIETVSRSPILIRYQLSNLIRLLQSPKDKMSLSVTSFVNLPLSTVPFVMTKTRLAKIVSTDSIGKSNIC